MANPYSILHNYNKVPLYNHQFDLLATGLQAKEQGLAQGRSAVQQAYNQFSNLDIFKEVDKEYAQDRLAEIMSYTDKYSSMDLSDPNLASTITKNMTQVLDDNVVNAIASTKLFKAEQAEWEEKKLKEPKLYSDGNRAYAMQFSEDWRKSDQVGAVYKGGGGFREFVDVEGYMTENLPKIAKDLGLEYIETSPGNGIFRETVTKKEVSRDRVQAALQGALNPKMKDQLQINAWNAYDKMPDEAVQQVYTQEHDRKVDFYQSAKEKYEALRNTTTDPNQIAIYESQIRAAEQGLTNLNQSTYDRVGKRGAYTSLYMEEWQDKYLDAYSHAPVEIKREVNALDEATANYKMKVAEFNLSQDKFQYSKEQDAIQNDLAAQRIGIARANLELKAQGKAGKQPSDLIETIKNPFNEVLNVVKNDPLEGKEATMSEVEWIQNQEKNAYNKFRSYFKDKISDEDMSSEDLITALKTGGNGQDKVEVKLKSGKKVTINFADKYVNTIATNFKNMVLEDAPVQKKAYQEVDKQAEKTLNKLVKASTTGDVSGQAGKWQDAVPQFQYKVKGTKDNFKIVPVDFEKAGSQDYNHYQALLKKKAKLDAQGKDLSWEDKASLDLYTKTAMYYSKSTSSDAKKIIQKSISKDYLWKSQTKQDFSKWEAQITPKTKGTFGETTGNYGTGEYLKNQMSLDEFTAWDLSSKTGLAEDFEVFSTTLENSFKTARGTSNYNPTKKVFVIDQKENPKTWAAVDRLFPGKLEKDYEVNIVPMNYENGMPMGKSRLVITDKDGATVESGSIELSPEQYQQFTGKSEQIRRDGFDASYGEFAQTLPLGDGSVESVTQAKDNGARYKRLAAEMYVSPSGAVVPYISPDFSKQVQIDYENRYQMGDFAKRKLEDLDNNLYNFKLEPTDEGFYSIGIYKGEQKVFTDVLELKSLNTSELSELKNRSQVYCRNAFLGYIEKEALTEATKR
jgi:hypothetical protein